MIMISGRLLKKILLVICVVLSFAPICAADNSLKKILPLPLCTEGWNIDGTVTFFNSDNLFDRINGEAELYFPYGFLQLAYARYTNNKNPQIAIDADVYKMGSLLDAFGIYASYRRKEDTVINIGAEGTISPSQLFFYQDKYFVRLQITGDTSLGQDIFTACAKNISINIPQNSGMPRELDALMLPAVEKKTERYIAQSLLGYKFFRRGVIAEANLKDGQALVFIVPGDSPEDARGILSQYVEYLETSGKPIQLTEIKDGISLLSSDPLYGNVYIEQSGSSIIGVIKFIDAPAAKQLAGQVREKR